jgi:hypothetical protein
MCVDRVPAPVEPRLVQALEGQVQHVMLGGSESDLLRAETALTYIPQHFKIEQELKERGQGLWRGCSGASGRRWLPPNGKSMHGRSWTSYPPGWTRRRCDRFPRSRCGRRSSMSATGRRR